jgi:hypothetical protein
MPTDTDKQVNLLRMAQEHIYEAIAAMKAGDWAQVGRQTFQAYRLLREVNRAAVSADAKRRAS